MKQLTEHFIPSGRRSLFVFLSRPILDNMRVLIYNARIMPVIHCTEEDIEDIRSAISNGKYFHPKLYNNVYCFMVKYITARRPPVPPRFSPERDWLVNRAFNTDGSINRDCPVYDYFFEFYTGFLFKIRGDGTSRIQAILTYDRVPIVFWSNIKKIIGDSLRDFLPKFFEHDNDLYMVLIKLQTALKKNPDIFYMASGTITKKRGIIWPMSRWGLVKERNRYKTGVIPNFTVFQINMQKVKNVPRVSYRTGSSKADPVITDDGMVGLLKEIFKHANIILPFEWIKETVLLKTGVSFVYSDDIFTAVVNDESTPCMHRDIALEFVNGLTYGEKIVFLIRTQEDFKHLARAENIKRIPEFFPGFKTNQTDLYNIFKKNIADKLKKLKKKNDLSIEEMDKILPDIITVIEQDLFDIPGDES